MAPGAELELHGSAGFWGPVCSVHWGSRSMSHKILLLLAIIGPILLIAAGGVAHVWGRRRKRPRAARPGAKKFELRRPRPCREKPYCHVWLSNWREAVTGEICIRRLSNDGVVPGSFHSV